MAWAGSVGSPTPRPAAVDGMSWVSPTAPAPLRAFGLKLDSWRMRPLSSEGSTPLRWEASLMRPSNWPPPAPAPPPAFGAVAVEAWALCSALAKLVEPLDDAGDVAGVLG